MKRKPIQQQPIYDLINKDPEMTELPKEVWVLRFLPTEEDVRILLVPPKDDDSTDVFMAWPTREQAEIGLKHQEEMYEIKAEVVRLFPRHPAYPCG